MLRGFLHGTVGVVESLHQDSVHLDLCHVFIRKLKYCDLIRYSKVCDAVSFSITLLYIATVLHNEQHSVLVPVYGRCSNGPNAVFISQ